MHNALHAISQSGRLQQHKREYRFALGISVIVFVLLAVMSKLLLDSSEKAEHTLLLHHEINEFRSRLESQITTYVQASQSLANYIKTKPDLTQDDFSTFASLVFENKASFRNTAAARDLVISHVHPLQGNESIAGIDYRNIPEQLPEVNLAIQSNKVLLTGPVDLLQGERALIARLPVMLKDRAWGIVSTVIYERKLLEEAGLGALTDIEIAIVSEISENQEKYLIGNNKLFTSADVTQTVFVPSGKWKIGASWSSSKSFPTSVWMYQSIILGVFLLWNFILYQRYKSQTSDAKKDLEIALQKDKFESFFNDNAANIVLLDSTGVIKQANRAFCRFFGVKAEEVQSVPLTTLLQTESHDFQRIINQDLPKYGMSAANCEALSSTGHSINIRLLFSLVQLGEKSFISVVIVNIDKEVAQQKQLELSANVFQFSKQAILITDADNIILSVNPAFSRITGFSAQEVVGKSPQILSSGEHPPSFYAAMFDSLKSTGYWEGEIINKHKDGSIIREFLVISTVKNKEDGIERYVATYTDITELKSHHETISRLQRMELIGQLSAGVAHDFNNILGVISGFTELMFASEDSSKNEKYAEKVNKAILRAKNLTSRMLLSSKKSILELKPRNINDSLFESRELLKSSLTPLIDLNFELDSAIEEQINSVDFEDVVLNLVINAKNAIDGAGEILLKTRSEKYFNQVGHVLIAAPEKSFAQPFVVFSVKDTGSGIQASKIEEIFLPFKSFREGGTGLGLSMVMGFVARYGYGLTIQSSLGVGTEISLWIPVSNMLGAIDSVTELEPVEGKQEKRIVVIDDEQDMLELMETFLLQDGHDVKCFTSAVTAIEYISNNMEAVDLIITDQIMPGPIQGDEIINRFKEHIACILVTGFADQGRIKNSGIEVIEKPFERRHFLKRVNSASSAQVSMKEPKK